MCIVPSWHSEAVTWIPVYTAPYLSCTLCILFWPYLHCALFTFRICNWYPYWHCTVFTLYPIWMYPIYIVSYLHSESVTCIPVYIAPYLQCNLFTSYPACIVPYLYLESALCIPIYIYLVICTLFLFRMCNLYPICF